MSDPTPWMAIAWSDLGVAAMPGPGISARVHKYYADAGHPEVAGDDVAWCAAFVGACLERAGFRSTRSLLARSYLSYGSASSDVRAGSLAVFSRGEDPALGHVGFVVGETSDAIILLGGNQANAVSVIPMPKARLLGLRWPTSTPASNPTPPLQDPEAATAQSFRRSLDHVLLMEGGYTDDPYDPGGPTNLGITLADLASYRGVAVTDASDAALKSAIKALTPEAVAPIYLSRYWQPSCSGSLPPALALFHFDTAVNQGISTAARMLQQSLSVDVDGEIGPITLAAASSCDLASTLDRYAVLRRDRYRALSTFWRFGKGWLARVDATRAAAAKISDTSPPTRNTKKEPPMSTTSTIPNTPAETSQPKWWGQSITIWGTIVTTLATVLPVVGPIIGLQISADVVHQIGDGMVQVVQAVAGVIGILMTVYGRTRAVQPLVRREFLVRL